MKVALVHDDLVQWGGAEKMLVAISEIFPDAPIYTSVYDKSNHMLEDNFRGKKIKTSFLQKVPKWKLFYRSLLPLYPLAFEQFDLSEFDVVISQSTRYAHYVITKPSTIHINYCHTPPRFLWKFSKFKINPLLEVYFDFARVYDQIAGRRVDVWVAGSKNVQKKVFKVYKKKSEVIYPFIDLKTFSDVKVFDGGYLLIISRLNSYKRVDLAVQFATEEHIPLKVIGTGPQEKRLRKIAGPTVQFLGRVNDDLLIKVMAGCKALIICAEEDFGLTSVEAQALGKPVIAYKMGGALETVIDCKTGYLFDNQTVSDLRNAYKQLIANGYNKDMCLKQAAFFSKEKFIDSFKKITQGWQ